MTRVVVRADAAPRVGSGHVMRCAALIQALRAQGADVELIGSGIPRGMARDLSAIGAGLTESIDGARDLDETVAAARRGSADARWVVVDGYQFDRMYMQGLRDAGLRVVWVDDLNALPLFDCDIVVNPTLGAERCAYRTAATTRVLAGGTYALLRREMSVAAAQPRQPQRQIVIALGGADPGQHTPDVIRAVRHADLDRCRVIAVVGPSNPQKESILAAAAGASHITVVQDPSNFADLLADSTLVITAAGTMTWELAVLGVPMILLIVADNQERGAAAIREAKAAEVVDARHGVAVDALSALTAAVWHDADRRAAMARRGRQIIDGAGAHRVARWIVAGAQPDAIRMRPATADDALQVWRINSEPSVRGQSFNPAPIPLDSHFGWFDRQLAEEATRMYVAAREDEIAGQIRYDRVDGRAELSFAVGSPFRGLGLGTRLLEDSWRTACRDLRVPAVRGLVIAGNEPSIAAFRRAGFHETGQEERAGRACLVFERRVA